MGFPDAIAAVYPQIEIRQCIIHQICPTTRYVSYKDMKKPMADLKLVYTAPTEKIALENLEELGEAWNAGYPKIYKSWHDKWPMLATYFKYPQAIRKIIYTTNIIEGFNRQLRKVTRSKMIFPSDDRLLKMLYPAIMDITRKWTGHWCEAALSLARCDTGYNRYYHLKFKEVNKAQHKHTLVTYCS